MRVTALVQQSKGLHTFVTSNDFVTTVGVDVDVGVGVGLDVGVDLDLDVGVGVDVDVGVDVGCKAQNVDVPVFRTIT